MRLVERDRALRQLRDGFEIARAGRQGLTTLVEGPSGFGKTSILNALFESLSGPAAVVLTAFGSRAYHGVPAGVLTQLLGSHTADGAVGERLDELLDEVGSARFLNGSDLFDARVLQRVCAGLLRIANERPLAICVDDAHHTDTVSQQFLLHLVRRLGRGPVLLVLTEPAGHHASGADPLCAELHDELARQPRFQRITLRPLSADGAGRLLAQTISPESAARRAAETVKITGANPQLLSALALDLREAGERAKTVVPGTHFQRAVRSCLHSCGRLTVEVARAVAVLADNATALLVARLTETDIYTVETAVASLNAAGLLSGLRFRHPAAREAVFNGFARDDRMAAHQLAANLLFKTGASATVVADLLVAAGTAAGTQAGTVLPEAAEQAMLDGATDKAKAYLSLIDVDPAATEEQARTAAALSIMEWRLNPPAAVRRLPQLGKAVTAGYLRDHTAVTTFENLLWYRGANEAEAALGSLCESLNDNDVRARSALLAARGLLESCFPPVLERVADMLPPWSADPAHPRISLADSSSVIATFSHLPWHGGQGGTAREAERTLKDTPLVETNLGAVFSAITTLVFADRPDQAAAWLERLAHEQPGDHTPAWQGVRHALSAEVALRHGDPAAAQSWAREALRVLPVEAWGVGLAVPVSTLVMAALAQGNLDDAVYLLDQPVPEGLFESLFGLRYLIARGYYRLASGRFGSALEEFTACGEVMREWGVDYPVTLPWRSGAAQAWLRLGDVGKAHQLAKAQVELLGDTTSRTKGAALRLLAATSGSGQRRALLDEAVAVLDRVGDRLELSRALRDLGNAMEQAGDPNRAGLLRGQAAEVARQAPGGPVPAFQPPSVPGPRRGGQTTLPATGDTMAPLTEAERRVSAMAAKGSSNREIASALSITVSTVEQHLTKAYKKLRITRRRDLPRTLPAD